MVEQMFQLFTSFYRLPEAPVGWILFAFGLALVFGAIWIAGFWPPLFKNWRLWLVLAGGIILPTIALSFIQLPLQNVVSQPVIALLGKYLQNIAVNLITGLLMAIISGLILQGVLLIPVIYYRLNRPDEFTPRFGLMVGALSGAAFGILQAYSLFSKFVEIGLVPILQANPISYLAFVDTFFAVALFAGTTALAGYALAKGKGWQAYLIFAGVNAVYDYISLIMSAKIISLWAAEAIVTLLALAAIGLALWLYWKKTRTEEKPA
ncbi:MAG: hypothetical protein A2Z02_01110 [Chloroflexi bacterium RBG_16_48_7]|nr:MAG: hypothetical protein A2Z02_01110 [Chloroflexi bacterium RBG_16_48_7]